jgi:hypothetical protein
MSGLYWDLKKENRFLPFNKSSVLDGESRSLNPMERLGYEHHGEAESKWCTRLKLIV